MDATSEIYNTECLCGSRTSVDQGRVLGLNSGPVAPINICPKVSHYEGMNILRTEVADGIVV
jgi:hypothetical protein